MVSSVFGFGSSLLLNYFQSQLTSNTQSSLPATASTTSSANSATANDNPPWEDYNTPAQQVQDAKVLSITNFMDTSNVPLSAGIAADAKTEQDNQKLFSLYTAVNNLAYLAKMSQRSGMTAGQLAGFNTRFQTGLQQVEDYISSTTFNNFSLQAAQTSSSVTSNATVALPSFSYTTKTLANDSTVNKPLAGVSSSQSFTISIKKNGVTTQVPIDLSQIQGGLTLNNIIIYANQQLAADGFSTRLQKAITGTSTSNSSSSSSGSTTVNSYGLSVNPGVGEAINFSAAASQPALYLAGSTGNPTTSATTSKGQDATAPADQQGRLVKLTNLSTSPQGVFTATSDPSTGTTTAQATAVDANGNVYVLGNATGDFGSQINQGTQDVYLTKYDSAGNVLWTQMVGSAGTASGYGLALDSSGNAYVTGSTTANLTPVGIGNGNTDSFVVKYDTTGEQVWTQQIPTLNTNQANAITVDSSGNVFLGGQVTGVIASGQTKVGGQDGYVAELNSKGQFVYKQQIGTTGTDQVSAMTTTSDGSLLVASVQNGHAVLSKYANGDATSTPVWTQDLGSLQNGGTISSIAVSGSNIYLSGTTTNGNLTGGTATVGNPSSGGSDAYVMSLTDSGTSVTANTVSYVGTSGQDQGGTLTVGSDGTVYLAGTTTGTFAGQTRNVANTTNAFVAAIGSSGSVNWVRQYGGADGQSTGAAVAIDPNGASVLDALGLPRGTLNLNQSTDLTTATTLRAGDSFQIKIDTGTSNRTTTITIDAGETLNSLVTKINGELVGTGKASVNYGAGAEGLKIQANPGTTLTFISGPADTDALGRLGIPPGLITNTDSKTGSSSSSSSTPKSGTQAYGLGLLPNMDISDSTSAGAVRAELLNVLSSIRNIYQKTNGQGTSSTSTASTSSGKAPSYLTSQLASYNLAINMLTGASSSGSTSSSTI